MSNLKAVSNGDASLVALKNEAQIFQKPIQKSTKERYPMTEQTDQKAIERGESAGGISNLNTRASDNLVELFKEISNLQKLEAAAKNITQGLQQRIKVLEDEDKQTTKLEAEKERVYEWFRQWSIEHEIRLSLESCANADAVEIIKSLKRQLEDAKVKACALECELQAYKDKCESLDRQLFRRPSWGPSISLQDTRPPVPSSLHLHRHEIRHLPPELGLLPTTAESQGVVGSITAHGQSPLVNELPVSTPCLGDRTLETSSNSDTDFSQPPMVDKAVTSLASLGHRVFNPKFSFDPRNSVSQRLRMQYQTKQT